jgi:hypothetical protein
LQLLLGEAEIPQVSKIPSRTMILSFILVILIVNQAGAPSPYPPPEGGGGYS